MSKRKKKNEQELAVYQAMKQVPPLEIAAAYKEISDESPNCTEAEFITEMAAKLDMNTTGCSEDFLKNTFFLGIKRKITVFAHNFIGDGNKAGEAALAGYKRRMQTKLEDLPAGLREKCEVNAARGGITPQQYWEKQVRISTDRYEPLQKKLLAHEEVGRAAGLTSANFWWPSSTPDKYLIKEIALDDLTEGMDDFSFDDWQEEQQAAAS